MANLRKALFAPAGGAGTWISVMISPAAQDGVAREFDIKEILGIDRARVGDDLGIQGDERGRDVAGMDRDALVDVAEDRVIAVVARHGKAGGPALADAVEAVFRFAEIPAAVQLCDVAADGPHIPDVRRGHAEGRLGQGRVLLD